MRQITHQHLVLGRRHDRRSGGMCLLRPRLIIPIGLEVKPYKSEVSNVSWDNFHNVMIDIQSVLPGVTVTVREDPSILVAPVNINGCHTGVPKAVEHLSAMSGRQKSIYADSSLPHLWNCLTMSRLLFKLRGTSVYQLHSELTQIDETLRQAASTVCNV